MIKINSRKFDGKIHRTWKGRLINQKDSLITVVGEFEKTVEHPFLGVIRRGTISYEFFWLDRWYSIFRFHEPDGSLRNFYGNINMPPKFEDNVLDYIDLDIDVYVLRDFSYQILDLEEFEENARRYSYPIEVKEKARTSVEELVSLIAARGFPFDY